MLTAPLPSDKHASPQDVVLAVNAGSSSLKFGFYGRDPATALLSGTIEGLEPSGTPTLRRTGHTPQAIPLPSHGDSFAAALACMSDTFHHQTSGYTLREVAHRIVHGGERYTCSVQIDDQVMADLQKLEPLAPLHQPHNLASCSCITTRISSPAANCLL